ncbi:MAG: maleylpyruvate isomerase family mycothiol-dependent enzyme [Acidimicrobiales bacterium]
MRPAAELLVVEADALPVVLDRYPPDALDRDTALAGWRVRDVLAHCGAALGHLIAGDEMVFTPEANQRDVDERAGWPLDRVLDELFDAYPKAAAIIDRADGLADGLGLGEWVHGGDIRDALGQPDAYGSDGIDLAVPLLLERSEQMGAASLTIDIDGEAHVFGPGPPVGTLSTDRATFVRLCAGRGADRQNYRITGAEPADLVIFS